VGTSPVNEAPPTAQPEDERRKQHVRWIAGVGAGILVVVLIAAFFSIHVCDQQLSGKGSVVRVCRHMQATDPPVLAAALVVLAALSVFFNEISGFGFTMKREVEKSVEKAEAAGQKAEAAGQTAEAAGQTAKAAHDIAVVTTTNAHETAEDLLTLRRNVLPPAEAAGTYA
jgi:hypothetical protein